MNSNDECFNSSDSINKCRNKSQFKILPIEKIKKNERNNKSDNHEIITLMTSGMNEMPSPSIQLKNELRGGKPNVEMFTGNRERNYKRKKCVVFLKSGVGIIGIILLILLGFNIYLLCYMKNMKGDMDKTKMSLEREKMKIGELEEILKLGSLNHTAELKRLENRMGSVETILLTQEEKLKTNNKPLTQPSMNGILIWKFTNFIQSLTGAKHGGQVFYESNPFYTNQFGYKMCITLYPNGKGDSENSHLSIYFHLMPSEVDDILAWPFNYNVKVMVMDQLSGIHHVEKSLQPNLVERTEAFQKPSFSTTNVAVGWQNFLSHNELTGVYLRNDILFIKVVVSEV